MNDTVFVCRKKAVTRIPIPDMANLVFVVVENSLRRFRIKEIEIFFPARKDEN